MSIARPPLEIDPDVRVARTPPAWLYTDRDVQARILECVLKNGWSLLLEPDPSSLLQVVPCNVAGEPTVWVRDGAEERLLSNVCTHRAATIVDVPCQADVLRCPYHGRRFRLDGSVLSAPGFDGAMGPEDALPVLSLGRAGPFRFGSVAPRVAFSEWWAPWARCLTTAVSSSRGSCVIPLGISTIRSRHRGFFTSRTTSRRFTFRMFIRSFRRRFRWTITPIHSCRTGRSKSVSLAPASLRSSPRGDVSPGSAWLPFGFGYGRPRL